MILLLKENASVEQCYLWVVEIVFTVLRQFSVVLKQNIVFFVYEKARKFAQMHIHTIQKGT